MSDLDALDILTEVAHRDAEIKEEEEQARSGSDAGASSLGIFHVPIRKGLGKLRTRGGRWTSCMSGSSYVERGKALKAAFGNLGILTEAEREVDDKIESLWEYLDEVDRTTNEPLLGVLSTAGRHVLAGAAQELGRRSVWLSREQGREYERMRALRVFGAAGAPGGAGNAAKNTPRTAAVTPAPAGGAPAARGAGGGERWAEGKGRAGKGGVVGGPLGSLQVPALPMVVKRVEVGGDEAAGTDRLDTVPHGSPEVCEDPASARVSPRAGPPAGKAEAGSGPGGAARVFEQGAGVLVGNGA